LPFASTGCGSRVTAAPFPFTSPDLCPLRPRSSADRAAPRVRVASSITLYSPSPGTFLDDRHACPGKWSISLQKNDDVRIRTTPCPNRLPFRTPPLRGSPCLATRSRLISSLKRSRYRIIARMYRRICERAQGARLPGARIGTVPRRAR
jgi:hypothetical protein